MLFYNEKGDESGGLRFGSLEKNGKYGADSGLVFDKYNGDQISGFRYNENNNERIAGFKVWDQPDVPLEEQIKNLNEARKMKDGPERDALRQQAVANERVFIGRTKDKSAQIVLSDPNSRPRIRLWVDAEGNPKIEFLDRDGKVVNSFTDSTVIKKEVNAAK